MGQGTVTPDLGNRAGHNGPMARHHRPPRQPLPLGPWAVLVGILGAVGLGLAVLPSPRQAAGLRPSLPQLSPQRLSPQRPSAPLPAERAPAPVAGLEGVEAAQLLAQLAAADAAWIPRAEPLPDGRIRYHYRRRPGEPELSLAEIQALIAHPPAFTRERTAIAELLALLTVAGVRIQIIQPRKAGAAAEWDPRSRSLRIKPSVLGSGSRQFAEVLNHEAIHVAQSCRGGGISAPPRPLGLSEQLPAQLATVLQEPLYSRASPAEQRLEREAYANQQLLELGALLVRSHCGLQDQA